KPTNSDTIGVRGAVSMHTKVRTKVFELAFDSNQLKSGKWKAEIGVIMHVAPFARKIEPFWPLYEDLSMYIKKLPNHMESLYNLKNKIYYKHQRYNIHNGMNIFPFA
ncbi:hypothetical protein SAMN02746064_02260, partial [Alkalibacter saccharofermentans DSM 14828]